MNNQINVPDQVAKEFKKSLLAHIYYVQDAGFKLGVPDEQLRNHDQSKWGDEEFAGYALHFKGGGAPDLFARAWLHHIHSNPHHWQYWIFSDGYTPPGSSVENGCVEMPRNFALEMVADWIGASRAYTGSDDMTAWLAENWHKIRLHSATREYLRELLDSMGYADVVNC